MAESDENTIETTEASAGLPRRKLLSESFSGLADTPEPTAAELDARQAAIGESRRSGPPLPEGEAGPEAISFSATSEMDEETEVAPPRPKDR